jgi:hypothetical protein
MMLSPVVDGGHPHRATQPPTLKRQPAGTWPNAANKLLGGLVLEVRKLNLASRGIAR